MSHPLFPITLDTGTTSTLLWADPETLAQDTLDQIKNVASLPWVHGVRVMPDVHLGYGCTIGSVIAMKDAVSPSAVGVDIGCGMIGVLTNLTAADLPENLAELRFAIEAAIPTGFHGHTSIGDNVAGVPDGFLSGFAQLNAPISASQNRVFSQLGSLGSGNHFIEACLDDQDRVWLQLHSGSRALGKLVAEWHINEAKTLEHNLGIADRDLAVFLASSSEMEAYMHDLSWAQEYAMHSRAAMMRILQRVFGAYFAERGKHVTFETVANVHHNYAREEIIDGERLIVTRKGAIRATTGEYGLIPGSMGTGSYIVKGLGNPESYFSASHGAGRVLSRNAARKRFSTADLAEQTTGVECRKDQGVLDEIPAAYKNLEDVIAAQTDLIEVVVRLRTILCVKG